MVRFGIALSSSSDEDVPTPRTDRVRNVEPQRRSVVGGRAFTANSSPHPPGSVLTLIQPQSAILPELMTQSQPRDTSEEISNGGANNNGVQSVSSEGAIARVDGGSDKDRREEDENFNVLDEEIAKDDTVLDLIAESMDNDYEDVNIEDHSNHATEGSFDSEAEEMEDVVADVLNPSAADFIHAVHDDETDDIAMHDEPVGASGTAPSLPMSVSGIGQGCGNRSSSDSISVKPATSPFLFMPETRMTFTPLQKWQYENGFQVDGITNTRSWAAEVGLEVGSQDPDVQRKRRKLLSATDPPKYGCKYTLNNILPDAKDGNSTPLGATSDTDEDEAPVSRKGKEKVPEAASDADEEGAPVSRKGKEKAE